MFMVPSSYFSVPVHTCWKTLGCGIEQATGHAVAPAPLGVEHVVVDPHVVLQLCGLQKPLLGEKMP